MSHNYSPTKKKILLLLSSGIELSFNRSPIGHIRIWKRLGREWKDINKEALRETIREFYRNRLIEFKGSSDGTTSAVITKRGRLKATRYQIDDLMPKKPKTWDSKWRVVIFDIPEEKRLARNILRKKIKCLGFQELQKSVWVYPYDCEAIIDFVIEFYKLEKYVKYMLVNKIKNDKKIRSHFDLG